jgi:hypothetical protein
MAQPLNIPQGAIVAPRGGHVLLTGPINTTVTKADGTEVDVSGAAILVDDQDEADEIAFLIGEHWVEHGHPDDVEFVDDKNDPMYGQTVQRPFVHDHPKKFDKHPAKFKGKPKGVPHGKKG